MPAARFMSSAVAFCDSRESEGSDEGVARGISRRTWMRRIAGSIVAGS